MEAHLGVWNTSPLWWPLSALQPTQGWLLGPERQVSLGLHVPVPKALLKVLFGNRPGKWQVDLAYNPCKETSLVNYL